MRLTDSERAAVREEVASVLGAGASVSLFGSRTDDTARGGDIDLYIEADGSVDELLDHELRLYARLIRRLGERRIDIVVHPRGHALRPIDEHARRTGVAL